MCPHKNNRSRKASAAAALLLLFSAALGGCAACPQPPPGTAFAPREDTPAFANEMHWVYEHDVAGRWHTRRRDPPPQFALHCFPMARMTREFFYHAQFDPALPRQEEPFYARAVDEVIGRNSRCWSSPAERVRIPGFADLHEFSAAFPGLLREKCGSAVSSYVQRGNWRVPFPFTRGSQARTARQLQQKILAGGLPILHLLEFPMLNHGVIAYKVEEAEGVLLFECYDPNFPGEPVVLRYYPSNKRFVLPRTAYFYGGDVNVYEVYSGWLY